MCRWNGWQADENGSEVLQAGGLDGGGEIRAAEGPRWAQEL